MRRLLLSALLVTACGPQFQASPCGLMLDGRSDTFDQAACDAVATVAWYYGQDRARLQFVVVVAPESLPDGIAGYTYCDTSRIVLDRDDWYPSALAHEAMHAARCSDLAGDPDHSTWGAKDDPASAWMMIERFHNLGEQQ